MNKLKTITVIREIQNNIKVKDQIKYKIATLREHVDPSLILPHNPIMRFIKKTAIFFLSPFFKSQIVFNKNTMVILEVLLDHIKQLEDKIKILEKKNK